MLSQMCLIDSKALPVTLQEWLSFTDTTCRPLYPCCLLRFLPLTCIHVELSHFASTVLWCSGSGFQPDGLLSSYTKPVFLFLATFHSCIVKQLSELASGRFPQIWRERRSHRHANRSTKQLECLPTVLLLEVPVERVIIKTLLQNRRDVGRPRPGGTLSITSFLFPSFCFFSLAEILHAHPHVLSSRHSGLSYMHMHTLIQLSSGSVSLWLITVCSPPADAGSGSGDDGKISHNFL